MSLQLMYSPCEILWDSKKDSTPLSSNETEMETASSFELPSHLCQYFPRGRASKFLGGIPKALVNPLVLETLLSIPFGNLDRSPERFFVGESLRSLGTDTTLFLIASSSAVC